jgi:hypothetical protein
MTAEVFNLGDVRRRARKPKPRQYLWLDTLKADPKIRNYPHLSSRFLIDLGEVLMSFSSFSLEGVYAGRKNLGRRLGVSPRQASRGVAAFADMGYLEVARRGRSTNLMTPILNGGRLFPSGPEVHSKVQSEWTRRSTRTPPLSGPEGPPNLLKQDINIHELNSPQSPEARLSADPPPSDVGDDVSPTCETGASGTTSRSLSTKEVDTVLDGEIVYPISFSTFWNGSRRHSDNKDKPGPARKAFDALSEEERQEITVLLDRDGEIDLGGEWSCIWLKARAWREPALHKSGIAGVFDRLRPRPGSREDRQEQTTLSRREFREHWQSLDADDPIVAGMANVAARRDAQREPEQYAVIEHTRAFDEWCQHFRRNHRVPPLAMDIVDQDGKRRRGWYMPTPYPPDDNRGSV